MTDKEMIVEEMTFKEFEFQYALGTISFEDLLGIAKYTKSKYIITVLSKHKDCNVRIAITENLITPTEILASLSKDENFFVRYWVINNLNVPVEILTFLSHDKNTDVSNHAMRKLRGIL